MGVKRIKKLSNNLTGADGLRAILFQLMISIILIATPFSNFFGKLMDNSFLKFTAKISFGLYIWHYLIIIILQNVWVSDYYYMGVSNFKDWLLTSLAVAGISCIIALLSRRFIEKPFMEWAHRKDFKIERSTLDALFNQFN